MAHVEISPNYNSKQICHFCKKNMAEENCETTRKCFYFEKVFHLTGVYHRYTYRMVEVLVPSCRECAQRDIKLTRISAILTLMIYVVSVYIISGIFAETDHIARNWSNILIACLPSIFIAILSFKIFDFIIRLIFEPKFGFNSFCDDYGPINSLMKIGFEPRDEAPSAKYNGIEAHDPLNKATFDSTLKEIICKDNCVVKIK